MKSRVHPKYKIRYRVTSWREYERGLVQRTEPHAGARMAQVREDHLLTLTGMGELRDQAGFVHQRHDGGQGKN